MERTGRTLAALGVVGATLTVLAACGLDENGLLAVDASQPTLDGSPADVADEQPNADVWVGPTCATIDASCLGDAEVPDGWVLLDIAGDAGACPGDSEDFEPHDLVANARLRSDSCSCDGCTTSGAWSCAGTVDVHGGTSGSCTDQSAQISNTAQCVSVSESAGLGCLLAQSATVSVTPPALAGAPTCDAGFTGTRLADTDKALGCKPAQCTSDYCGLRASGFQTCIVHNGDSTGVCPDGFVPAFGASALATAPDNVVVTCEGCGCTVPQPGACTGSVRVFGGLNSTPCDGDGGTNGVDYRETLDATAACQNTQLCAYDSLYYVPDPTPSTSCSPSSPSQGAGDASLVGAVTVCCTP